MNVPLEQLIKIWKAKESFTNNSGHNILTLFSMLYQILFSSHVKRSVTITNKHGMYNLPQKLPSDLRLRILEIRKL